MPSFSYPGHKGKGKNIYGALTGFALSSDLISHVHDKGLPHFGESLKQ